MKKTFVTSSILNEQNSFPNEVYNPSESKILKKLLLTTTVSSFFYVNFFNYFGVSELSCILVMYVIKRAGDKWMLI